MTVIHEITLEYLVDVLFLTSDIKYISCVWTDTIILCDSVRLYLYHRKIIHDN